MKRTLLTLIPILAIMLSVSTGCGKKARFEKQLIGKWELDTEGMQNAVQSENPLAAALIPTMNIELEFNKDGTVQMSISAMGSEQTEETTWEVIKVSGKTATVKMEDETGSITFISDDEIEMENAGEKTRLKRVK